MMEQYRRIRKDLPADTILLFRLGDFYEMFFDDAKEASQILDIALTKRNTVPMCGVPHHSMDLYLAKLIRAGKKVAICEQMEDPSVAKGIVRRDITRIVTPGTILEENVLDAKLNNYLASIYRNGNAVGLAYLDLSTGVFWIEELSDASNLADSLGRQAPSECIVPEADKDFPAYAVLRKGTLTPYEDWTFEMDAASDLLTRHFKVQSLDGFGCRDNAAGIRAAGAVLHYVTHALRRPVDHIRRLQVKNPRDYMLLDEETVRNLDLVESRNSVLSVLDVTKTSMGGRLLRDWLLRPLNRADAIRARQDAVDVFAKNRQLQLDLRETFIEIKDLERLIARLNAGTGNARDVRAMGRSLEALPKVLALLSEGRDGGPSPSASVVKGAADAAPKGLGALPTNTELLDLLRDNICPLPALVDLIDRAIVEEPPIAIRDGGLIKLGYHAELDVLKDAGATGKQWLADFQAREQERTGVKSLKVRYNKVFGYYIEITNANIQSAPAEYIRKQTLVNCERFITPELKEYENKILGAEERSVQLELELFQEIRAKIVAETAAIQRTADAVAQLDVLAALADRAAALRYIRPTVTDGDILKIREGRHPVIEGLTGGERFVPNDTLLDGAENQVMIITGPNMAGKSTYIRQVAVITVLAHVGSFVPAHEAEIGLVDRVFTRVGASDDLARGRSTFMVEMQETANILNNATAKSLIVLDEIGRGTSTFDGISIAWAVAEHLHNHVKAKTLFATHYHELTDLSLTMKGVKNYNVLVKESGDRIAFLRRIVPGAADKSYGIQVARLAGLPGEVIDRAREILNNLEDGEFEETGQPKLAKRYGRKGQKDTNQLSLFGG
jgi:DNA mismatch repair protein MutS